SGGDKIHVCNTTGGFVVEGAAGCVIDNDTKLTGDTPTTRFSVTDGPNGQGEFYYNDYSSQYDSLGGARHVENNLGSVTVLPGSNQVLVTGYDVIIGDFNQGFHWYETRTGTNPGARVSQYQLSVEGANDVNTKGMGLGDIELLVAAAPIEIGNRVWDDLNGNGIQDPGEPGLNGVTVTLETPTGANSTVTSGDGNYYFAVEPYTPYTVTIGTVAGYQLTVPNAAALDASNLTSNHAISDTRDSDALLVNNVPTITYTTGDPGQNNHGLDFGFVQPASGQVDILNIAAAVVPPSIAIEKRLNTMAPILPGEEVNFTINITNTGSISITSLPLTDTYDLNYLTFDTVMDALGPNPATEATNDGSIYWANVIDFDNDGQFDPNEVLSLTVSFNAKAATTGSNGGMECEPVGYTYNKASTNGEESCVAVQIDPAPGKSTLGDFVWYDVNGDGIKDAGEQGIDGVRVELYEVVDLGGGITETQFITFQITGPDRPDVDSDDTPTYGDAGAYDFAVLDNKIYQVVITDTNFLPGGALENYVYTGENASEPYSGPAPRTVAIGTQEDYNDADFPFTQIPSLQVTKVLNGVNPFGVGMPVSFSIRVTNTGGVTITTLPLEDRYSSVFIAYDSATPAPDSALDGVLIWNDLLASLNDTDGLGAGESVSVDVMFTTGADTTLLSAIAPCVEDGQAPNLVWVNNAMADTMPVVMDADDSDCASVQILNPTGIQLAEHSVQQTAAGVLVRWRMVEETNVMGFYVWRVNGVESSRRSEMILTQVGGQQSNGAAYEWLDAGATLASGDTYVLEIVYTDGAVERTVINVVQGVSLYLPLMQR
ncbi:MAG: hypothetical protein KDE46_17680, partial [Caldilineaceae bacterium]|nr:hypothetical protein [Caldilineaceae bacterium]